LLSALPSPKFHLYVYGSMPPVTCASNSKVAGAIPVVAFEIMSTDLRGGGDGTEAVIDI
jgi:hypothetical protein